jgi:ammonium transporter Rh
MLIHVFGAYFGLFAGLFFNPHKVNEARASKTGGNHQTNLVAMFGTLFLFMYWPSFNAALAAGPQQTRAIINTFCAMSGSVFLAIFTSRLCTHELDIDVVINATLAGGVTMGASCDVITNPGFAFLTGGLIGIVSALGFLYGNRWVENKIGIHDTCGVQWLHGIPGIYGGIVSAICAAAGMYNFGSKEQLALIYTATETRS